MITPQDTPRETPGTAQADDRPVDAYLNLYRAARAVWPFLEGIRLLAFDSTETQQRVMGALASALVAARNDLTVRTTANLGEPPAVPPSDRERELELALESHKRELEHLVRREQQLDELLELRKRAIFAYRDELAAAERTIARLRYALAHYTDSTIVASWPMRALGDNGQIARAALGLGDHAPGCDWVTREQCKCGYEGRVAKLLRELSQQLLSTPRDATGTAQANDSAPARPSAPAGAPAAEPPRYDFYLVRRELLEQTRVELRNRLDAHPDAVAHVLDMSRSQIAVLLGLIDLELSTPARPLLDTMRAHAAEYREKLRELDESGEAHTRPKYRTQLESRLAELDEIMRDQGAELLPFELETPSAPPQVPTIVHAERVLRRTRLEQLRDRFAGYRDQLRELDDEIKHAFERGHVNTDWMKDKHNRLSLRLSELRAVASICGYKLGDDDEQK